jgi:TatD DNase family protein
VIQVFDTHAHLDQIDDVDVMLGRAQEAGLVGVVGVGIDMRSNEAILELAERWPELVLPALGLHPSELGGLGEAAVERELSFIEANMGKAVAVGEIGLDYHKRVRAETSKERQRAVFREMLSVARRHDVPALVHSRYAWTDALEEVTAAGVRTAVFHWFTGFAGVLKGIMDAGYYISATPAAEYHEEHRRAVRAVSSQRLLLETDAPVWYGREIRYQSSPLDILRSLEAVAEVRDEAVDVVARTTTTAAMQLFRIGISPDSEED